MILHEVPTLSKLKKVGTEVGKRGFLYEWHSNTCVSNAILIYLWVFLTVELIHTFIYDLRSDRPSEGKEGTLLF